MIVVDASVLATVLIDQGAEGERARLALRDQDLTAPELIDLEGDARLANAAGVRCEVRLMARA